MKYLIAITSLIVVGVAVVAIAQVDGKNLRQVETVEMDSVGVSCIQGDDFTFWNCNNCCSKSCDRFSYWFPYYFLVCNEVTNPSNDDDRQMSAAGMRPRPSSSYVASPIFTTN
eukprot:scaffold34194_cov26-Cyclotella_meneghiniana.AAC.2